MNLLHDQELWSQMKQVTLALKPSLTSLHSGIHEFRQRGRSLEFAEYREYVAGEDLRNLDWKVYARTDRYYLKQRESQHPGRVKILLDDSASMQMKSETARISKLNAALLLAFGIGFVLQRQGDSFSFHALSKRSSIVSTRNSMRAFRNFVKDLGLLASKIAEETENGEWPPMRERTMDHLYCISDFMQPHKVLADWLDRFRRISTWVHCFQVLDPLETGRGASPAHVLDLESPRERRLLSSRDWRTYLRNLMNHQRMLRNECRKRNVHFQSMQTDSEITAAIRGMLEKNGNGRGVFSLVQAG